MVEVKQAILKFIKGLIRGYQWFLSPVLPMPCRFAPSCSEYAMEAFSTHGVGKGGWLSLRRLMRCHPFHPGGIDRVPLKKRSHEQ